MGRDTASTEPSPGTIPLPARDDRSRVRLRAAARKTWLFRAVGALVLALTFGYVPYHLYARSGFAKFLALREDLRARQTANARLRAENERLRREIESLRSDMRAIERVARVDLGWVHPGEVIFDFSRSEPGTEVAR